MQHFHCGRSAQNARAQEQAFLPRVSLLLSAADAMLGHMGDRVMLCLGIVALGVGLGAVVWLALQPLW